MYYIYIIDVHSNWISFLPFPPVFFSFLMLLVIYFIAYILNSGIRAINWISFVPFPTVFLVPGSLSKPYNF